MGRNATVLVVDDDRALRELVSEALADEGYDVRRARDGAEALAAVERERPDVVLTDAWMPGLDGAQLARQLQAKGVPVVLMSAVYADIDLPGVPFLPKPFDLDRLLDVVTTALGDTGEVGSRQLSNDDQGRPGGAPSFFLPPTTGAGR